MQEFLRRHGLVEGLFHRFFRLALAVQRGFHGVVHRVKHRLVRHELHHRLGGVDVHVHLIGGQRDVEDTAGEFSFQQPVFIRFLHGSGQKLALYQSPVDEEELPRTTAVTGGGTGDEAGQGHRAVAAVCRQQRQGEVPPQRGVNGVLQLAVARRVQHLCAVPQQPEGHIGVAQRQLGDDGGGRRTLGAVLFHEFHAGGGVEKQVADDDGGTHRTTGGGDLLRHAALQMELRALLRLRQTGEHVHPCYGGDGRQRLTAKAQRADGVQVIGGTQLAGGVAEKGGGELMGGDAAAVVGDAEIRQAALFQLHRHGGGAGVQRVLQQLLAHGGRALHHLTGGDQVRQMGG